MEGLNIVYVVQYSDILGGTIELGGIHCGLESAINEVEKNGYEYVDNGDDSMLYEREDGEYYPSCHAEIIEREIIDRFEDEY